MVPIAVLLVEDEAAIQEVVALELEDAGFEVVTASNGAEAAAKLEAEAERFRAIVTDIRLAGGGLDGWDLGRLARECVSTIAVVYMTGDSGVEWPAKGVPDSLVITKPFAPVQLVTAIATLINEADTRGAG